MDENTLLEKASRSLTAAERLLNDGDRDFAASRAYYGLFYVAQALLDSRGLRYSRHGQVVAQYGRQFAKTGDLDPSFHHLLDTAFELRQLADYEAVVEIEEATVRELIGGGRRFLKAAVAYLTPESPAEEASSES